MSGGIERYAWVNRREQECFLMCDSIAVLKYDGTGIDVGIKEVQSACLILP